MLPLANLSGRTGRSESFWMGYQEVQANHRRSWLGVLKIVWAKLGKRYLVYWKEHKSWNEELITMCNLRYYSNLLKRRRLQRKVRTCQSFPAKIHINDGRRGGQELDALQRVLLGVDRADWRITYSAWVVQRSKDGVEIARFCSWRVFTICKGGVEEIYAKKHALWSRVWTSSVSPYSFVEGRIWDKWSWEELYEALCIFGEGDQVSSWSL